MIGVVSFRSALLNFLLHGALSQAASREVLTLPVPPSPTRTSLKVGTELAAVSAMVSGVWRGDVVCEGGSGQSLLSKRCQSGSHRVIEQKTVVQTHG